MKRSAHTSQLLKWWLFTVIALFMENSVMAQAAIPKKQRIVIDNMMKEGAYNEALNSVRELMPMYPDNAEIEMLAGMCYSNLSAYKDLAITTFKKALTLNPDENLKIEILNNLANTQMNVGLYKDAIDTYNQLQELVPATFIEFKKQIRQKIVQCDNLIKGVAPTAAPILADNQAAAPKKEATETTAEVKPTATAPDTVKKAPINTTSNALPQDAVKIIKDTDVPANVDYIYTIQICALSLPAAKNRFKEKNNIKFMKDGNIYKYFYSQYNTIDEARDSLPKVQSKYPGAYITRYNKQDEAKISRYNN
ncbi:MAG: hypothetical protein ACRDDZ_07365 [Marinifilaceae bacterium]